MKGCFLFVVVLILLVSCAGPTPNGDGSVRLEGSAVDADTGAPLPCRIYVEGADGSSHLVESASGEGSVVHYEKKRGESVEIHSTLSAHPFVAELAPGEYRVTAVHGKDFLPASETVNLGEGPAQVTLKLKRWIDMAERGWYSGDTHVHRSLEELRNVVPAEDLNLSFPLLYWVTKAYQAPGQGDKNTEADTPAEVIELDPVHLIWPRNSEYEIFTVDDKAHTLGAVFVIGHQGVFTESVPPVLPVAEHARKEGALLELDKHAWPWSMALVPIMDVDLYELTNNHMWRTDFAFTTWGEPAAPYMNIERTEAGWTEWGWTDYTWQNYYALLNCGFRLRPTAGTASGVHPVPLGFGRVYVKVDGPLTVEAWLRGLSEGRSFVTTGPMLTMTVNGRQAGHAFEAAGAADYMIAVTVESEQPLDRIELIKNGEISQTLTPASEARESGGYMSVIDVTVSAAESAWFAVRAIEGRPEGRFRFAHSSPVFIDVAGKPLRPRKAEVEYLMNRVQDEITRSEGVVNEAGIAEYRQALAAYEKIAKTARP